MAKNDTHNGVLNTNAPEAADEADKIIAEARAEADRILEDARKKAADGAKKKPDAAADKAKPTDPGEELVPVRLFRDNGKYKDDVFVAVNGERLQIKRGEDVFIKRKFADVLQQSDMQDTATAIMTDQQSSEYSAKASSLGV